MRIRRRWGGRIPRRWWRPTPVTSTVRPRPAFGTRVGLTPEVGGDLSVARPNHGLTAEVTTGRGDTRRAGREIVQGEDHPALRGRAVPALDLAGVQRTWCYFFLKKLETLSIRSLKKLPSESEDDALRLLRPAVPA